MSQQQLLTQELSIAQILRVHGKQFKQIKRKYSDELDGRCAIGVIMSHFGWDGKHHFDASNSLLAALHAFKKAGVPRGLVIQLNDSGATFDEIADCLE